MHLHYHELGVGKPLLVLHGLLGSHQNLLPACRKFAERFHVFAIDQRNHGRSPHHDEMNYDVMADDLARLMDRHNLARAHALGHSMGGKTAMQFALNHPARVSKLVVVDMSPRAYEPRFSRLLHALRQLHPGQFKTRHQADAALAGIVPDESLRQFLLKNLMPDEHGGYRWRVNLESIATNADRLRDAVRSPKPFMGETLFLLGAKSDYVTEADRPEINKLFPRTRFESIADAGHWVHADKPAEFAGAVMRFLATTT